MCTHRGGIFSVNLVLMFYIVVDEAAVDPTDPEAAPPGEDAPPGEEAPPGAVTDAKVIGSFFSPPRREL